MTNNVHPIMQDILTSFQTKPAISRIAELEASVKELGLANLVLRDRLNRLCPSDTVATMPDGSEVVAEPTVVRAALIELRTRHAFEWDTLIDAMQVQWFRDEKLGAAESRAQNRIEDARL